MARLGQPVEKLAPLQVAWAFAVGVDSEGIPVVLDHEEAWAVRSSRKVTVDDIYMAAYLLGKRKKVEVETVVPEEGFRVAFLVFQTTDGFVAANPDVHMNISCVSYPTDFQIEGALHVVQAQYIAGQAAELAAQVAVSATMSTLVSSVPEDPNKTKGGLIVA